MSGTTRVPAIFIQTLLTGLPIPVRVYSIYVQALIDPVAPPPPTDTGGGAQAIISDWTRA